ncbi:MAG: hypothetical protein VW270_26315 [Candidatus Poseidoniales archaeon]
MTTVRYMIMLCTCADEGKKQEKEMCIDGCGGDLYGEENKRFADKMIREEPHTIKYVAKYIRDKWGDLISDDMYWPSMDEYDE